MQKIFCCKKIQANIDGGYLSYEPIDRTYGIPKGKRLITSITHCPWCGVELPNELVDEFYSVLSDEYEVHNPNIPDLDNVPEEFRSDAWWKKRGL